MNCYDIYNNEEGMYNLLFCHANNHKHKKFQVALLQCVFSKPSLSYKESINLPSQTMITESKPFNMKT